MAFRFQNLFNWNVRAINRHLTNEFIRFENYLEGRKPVQLYTSAPVEPVEGMIVRADGTSWDPGSGRGFYGYDNGAWVFLG